MYIPPIPLWMQTIFFNYCDVEIDDELPASTQGSMLLTSEIVRYVAYNKRHNPVLQLILYSASKRGDTGVVGEYRGTLVFNPWSWDENQFTKENRLGIVRPGNYAFANELSGEIKIDFADVSGLVTNAPQYEITTIQETYNYYDAAGRRSKDYVLFRAATGQRINISFLRWALEGCKLDPVNPVFPAQVKQWDLGFTIFGTPFVTAEEHIYTQLSSQSHTIYVQKSGEDGGRLPAYAADLTRVLAPIPRRQRVQALDTGQWAEVSLEESAPAAAARYYGMVFNNAYVDLSNQDDTGVQQMLAAVDADFTSDWNNRGGVNFNDIRALQSMLLNYVGVLASYTCRQLGIRYQYVDYIAAVITYYESIRGLSNSTNYGSHTFYPWLSNIKTGYPAFLDEVFELLAIELSANDSPAFLLNQYKSGIGLYIPWLAGVTTKKGYNIARLGDRISDSVKERMKKVQEFRERYMWAAIDRELTAAYMADAAFSGGIAINDPAVIVRPGDSVQVSFLDSTQILKVVGIDMTISSEGMDYSAQVKKQW